MVRLRKWLSRKLGWLACRLWPYSPEVYKFYSKVLEDEMIYGKSIVRVDPAKYRVDQQDEG